MLSSLNALGVGVVSTAATIAAVVTIAALERWRVWRRQTAWRRAVRRESKTGDN